jgi:hypothetical protein
MSSGQFEPGKSGNPGGRPKVVAEVRDLARAHTVDAIEALATIAGGDTGRFDADGNVLQHPPAARVAAAIALLDRAWGKAPLAVTGEGGEGPVLTSIEVVFVKPPERAE